MTIQFTVRCMPIEPHAVPGLITVNLTGDTLPMPGLQVCNHYEMLKSVLKDSAEKALRLRPQWKGARAIASNVGARKPRGWDAAVTHIDLLA